MNNNPQYLALKVLVLVGIVGAGVLFIKSDVSKTRDLGNQGAVIAPGTAHTSKIVVDLKVNNSDIPPAVSYGNVATVTWTAVNSSGYYGPIACTPSGDSVLKTGGGLWNQMGAQSATGSVLVYARSQLGFLSPLTFSISCNDLLGIPASDSVSLPVTPEKVSEGNLYIADWNNNRIQEFTSNGAFITKWGSYGLADGQFHIPEGTAVSPLGDVYVTDNLRNRIQKFKPSGIFITKWGNLGTGNGQFNGPEDIAVSSSGNVYVTDSNNNRIQEFTSSGTYITQWGSFGTGNGQFNYPESIAIAPSGNIYVADVYNHRIQEFTSNGVYITQWGNLGQGNGQFHGPIGIAVAPNGNVYVSDTTNRIQEFTSNGVYITQWGFSGTGNGQFDMPDDIVVSPSGNVYISDSNNDRIQEFTSNGTYITQWGLLGNSNGRFDYPEGLALSPSTVTTNTAGCTTTLTQPVLQITQTSGVFNGCYQSNNYLTTTYFKYGITPTLGSATPSVVQGSANGPAAFLLSGLSPNTTYYYRIVSQNSTGTLSGSIMSFTTLP